MSKRAEEKLCEACCPHYNKTPDECGFTEREMQWDCPYFDFIQRGYEQAEKDLALTWRDMMQICDLFLEINYNQKYDTVQDKYEKILEAFNEWREKK